MVPTERTAAVMVTQSTEEFERRLDREIEKAGRKYGVAALLPGGHPEKDVHDYAINELVGLVRYADMIEERLRLLHHAPTKISDASLRLMLADVRRIRIAARLGGSNLITGRNLLRRTIGSLGDAEYPEDQ